MPNVVGVPFSRIFPHRKWWPRNRKWRPFEMDWVLLVIYKNYRNKWGVEMLFLFPRAHWSFITFTACFKLCIFPNSLWWICGQVQTLIFELWIGLSTSIGARLDMKDFGAYNKSHKPARKNMDRPDLHYGWSVGRPSFFLHSTGRWV